MPSAPPLDICILWHMHQPLYLDPSSGAPLLPWARLHALKDYYDMVALVREHPGVQVTFNLVPSLIEQLEQAAGGGAPDRWLEVARRPADALTGQEQAFLLDSFFAFHHERIFPLIPRLAELHRLSRPGAAGPAWTAADWRDLQTGFHLAWCGNALRADPLVRRLLAKRRGFTEPEKHALLDLQQEFLRRVLPAYAAARDEGRIELTTSPEFHPILPLLCDLSSAREATPGAPLPGCPPRAPEEARAQIASGLAAFERRFGARPAGLWPPEGALSEEALDLIEEAGVRWTATDEELLHASLRASGVAPARSGSVPEGSPLAAYHPGDRSVAVFFRDRILSDLIGFTYASWNASSAATDFVERARAIAARRPDGFGGVLAVILDGENAWETYPHNGADFLDALYGALERAPDLRAVTFSAHLASSPDRGGLNRLRAGSWIRGDLLTWVGHPEKNRAWEMLGSAREAFRDAGSPAEGLRWLRAAEGSDWFWWFGDDHSSAHDSLFDQLYRSCLRAVWESAGREAPAGLAEPIKKRPGRPRVTEPTGAVSPVVDGRVTDYFEWLGAGSMTAGTLSAVLHAAAPGVRSLHFGADGEALALRVDPIHIPFRGSVPAAVLALRVTSPRPAELIVPIPGGGGAGPEGTGGPPEGVEIASDRVLETRIPLALLGAEEGEILEFSVALLDGRGGPVATFPPEGVLAVRARRWSTVEENWAV